MEKDNKPEVFEAVDIRIGKVFAVMLVLSILGVLLMSYIVDGKSEEEKREHEAEKAADIEEMTSKNSPPTDYSLKLSPVLTYSINGAVEGKWVHFSFSKGTEFYGDTVDKNSLDWDIAINRARIVTNGGKTNPGGQGAVAVVPGDRLDVVKSVPETGFLADVPASNVTETTNPNLSKWYIYNFIKHTLTPKREVYVVRTADGHHAKLKLLSYYCGEAVGCYTFKYVYNGTGTPSFE